MAEDSMEELNLMPEKLTIGQLLEIFLPRFPVIITTTGQFNGNNLLRDIQPSQVLVATHVIEQKRLVLKNKINKAIISIPEFFPHRLKLINRFDRVIKIETIREFLNRPKKDKYQKIEFETDFNNVRTSSGALTTASQLGKMKFHDVSFEQFLVVHPIENSNITFNPTAIPVDAEIRVQIVQGHKEMSEDDWSQMMKRCSNVFEEDNQSEPPELNEIFVWFESTAVQENLRSSYNALPKRHQSTTAVSTKSKHNSTSSYQSYYSARDSSRGKILRNNDPENRVSAGVTVARLSDSIDAGYRSYKTTPSRKQAQSSHVVESKNKSGANYAHYSKSVKIDAGRNHLEDQKNVVRLQPPLQHPNHKLSSPRPIASIGQPEYFKFNEVGKTRQPNGTVLPKSGVIALDSKQQVQNNSKTSPHKISGQRNGRRETTVDKLPIEKSKITNSRRRNPLDDHSQTLKDANNNNVVAFNKMTIESDEDGMDQVDAEDDGVFVQIRADGVRHNLGLTENQLQVLHTRRENSLSYQKRSYSVPPVQLQPQQSLKVVGDQKSKKQLSEDTKCMYIDDSGSDDADVDNSSQTVEVCNSSNNIKPRSQMLQNDFSSRTRDDERVMFFEVHEQKVEGNSSRMDGRHVDDSKKQLIVVNKKTDDFLPLKESSRRTEIYRNVPIYTENPTDYKKIYRYSGEVVVKKADRGNLYSLKGEQPARTRYVSDSEFSDVEKLSRHRLVSYRIEDRVYVSPPKSRTSKSSVRLLSDTEQHTVRQKNLKGYEVHLRDSRSMPVPQSQRNSRISYSGNEMNEHSASFVLAGSQYGQRQHVKPAASEKIHMINSKGHLFIREIPLTYLPNHSISPVRHPASASQSGIYKQVINISG